MKKNVAYDNCSLSPNTHIVLYRPDIAQNMGNIIRTCSVTGIPLSYVPPTGFSLNSKELRRSGLDYINTMNLSCIFKWEAWLEQHHQNSYFFSSHATKPYYDCDLTNRFLIFGSETSGLPDDLKEKYPNQFITMPMLTGRCLNLSTTVGIAIYESIRQCAQS